MIKGISIAAAVLLFRLSELAVVWSREWPLEPSNGGNAEHMTAELKGCCHARSNHIIYIYMFATAFDVQGVAAALVQLFPSLP